MIAYGCQLVVLLCGLSAPDVPYGLTYEEAVRSGMMSTDWSRVTPVFVLPALFLPLIITIYLGSREAVNIVDSLVDDNADTNGKDDASDETAQD